MRGPFDPPPPPLGRSRVKYCEENVLREDSKIFSECSCLRTLGIVLQSLEAVTEKALSP